jgi:hypothetical protein
MPGVRRPEAFPRTPHSGFVETHQFLLSSQEQVHVGVAPRLALIGQPLDARLVLLEGFKGRIDCCAAVGGKAVARRREVVRQFAEAHGPDEDACRGDVGRHGLDGPDVRWAEA